MCYSVQALKVLEEAEEHAHYGAGARPEWAVSKDGGLTWERKNEPTKIGKVLDTNYASPLKDGEYVTLPWGDKLISVICRGKLAHWPTPEKSGDGVEIYSIEGLARYIPFYRHDVHHLSNGTIIAAGYPTVIDSKSPTGKKCAIVFLESKDQGKTWDFLSRIPNPNLIDFYEPSVLEVEEGRLIAILRSELNRLPKDQLPSDAPNPYCYYLYQSESTDYGKTWSEPKKLDVWGHPAQLRKLTSGNIIMVYGVRRKPYSVQAILSRDGGRTWDKTTEKTLHTWNPGSWDIGYPVVTRNSDGSIVCSYYGYSTDNVTDTVGQPAPHGIFVSVFDEKWMESSIARTSAE